MREVAVRSARYIVVRLSIKARCLSVKALCLSIKAFYEGSLALN